MKFVCLENKRYGTIDYVGVPRLLMALRWKYSKYLYGYDEKVTWLLYE